MCSLFFARHYRDWLRYKLGLNFWWFVANSEQRSGVRNNNNVIPAWYQELVSDSVILGVRNLKYETDGSSGSYFQATVSQISYPEQYYDYIRCKIYTLTLVAILCEWYFVSKYLAFLHLLMQSNTVLDSQTHSKMLFVILSLCMEWNHATSWTTAASNVVVIHRNDWIWHWNRKLEDQ